MGPSPSGEYLNINAAITKFAAAKKYPIEDEKISTPN
jgi:hypothetical protein